MTATTVFPGTKGCKQTNKQTNKNQKHTRSKARTKAKPNQMCVKLLCVCVWLLLVANQNKARSSCCKTTPTPQRNQMMRVLRQVPKTSGVSSMPHKHTQNETRKRNNPTTTTHKADVTDPIWVFPQKEREAQCVVVLTVADRTC